MKEKYIEEKIPRWFVLGTYPDGCVDVNDGDGDIFLHVPSSFAADAIFHRNAFVDAMVAYWMERPEEWYRIIDDWRIKRVAVSARIPHTPDNSPQ